MNKEQMGQLIFALTIVATAVCFALGATEGGYVLAALAGGHALPSPFPRRDPPPTGEGIDL